MTVIAYCCKRASGMSQVLSVMMAIMSVSTPSLPCDRWAAARIANPPCAESNRYSAGWENAADELLAATHVDRYDAGHGHGVVGLHAVRHIPFAPVDELL